MRIEASGTAKKKKFATYFEFLKSKMFQWFYF